MNTKSMVEGRAARSMIPQRGVTVFPCPPSSPRRPRPAFTLVELLAVIAVIGVLAAFLIPVLAGVSRTKDLNTARAEMSQLETAIESYHDTYGFYPPDNGDNVLTNQLYYELEGTTNTGSLYTVLGGGASIPVNDVPVAFKHSNGNVGGFVNCDKPGASETTQPARNFLPELKANQIGTISPNGIPITNLVTSIGGPDASYEPLGVPNLNPWRYKSSGTLTNNPGSYELWIQLVIHGKTNLICNWSKTVQINSPLP